jgi:hypothetical protein
MSPAREESVQHTTTVEVGARIAAAELGRDRDRLRWRRSDPLKVARSATLAHRVAVNEFFVRLAVEARAAGGALREWYGERTTQRLLDGIAAPDGYGVVTLPNRDPLHLLLELDRGTESLSRIREKVDRYAKAIPRSELADVGARLLFTVPTASRAQSTRNLLPAHADVVVWTTATSGALLPVISGPTAGVAAPATDVM